MISKKEYKEKYDRLINNDLFKFVEQTIDENIIRDKLEDELILSTYMNEETVKQILSLISNKYKNNGWDNLFFSLNNLDFLYNYNDNSKYKIKYTLS